MTVEWMKKVWLVGYPLLQEAVEKKGERDGLWEAHASTAQEDLCFLRSLHTIQMANGSLCLSCNWELSSPYTTDTAGCQPKHFWIYKTRNQSMINRVKYPTIQMATHWCLISMCEINEGSSFECSAVWGSAQWQHSAHVPLKLMGCTDTTHNNRNTVQCNTIQVDD